MEGKEEDRESGQEKRVRPDDAGVVSAGAFSADQFLRRVFGKSYLTRNDCGYEGRFEFEDTTRMHGWQEGG